MQVTVPKMQKRLTQSTLQSGQVCKSYYNICIESINYCTPESCNGGHLFLYCINSVIYMSCVLETAHLKVACKSGQILWF